MRRIDQWPAHPERHDHICKGRSCGDMLTRRSGIRNRGDPVVPLPTSSDCVIRSALLFGVAAMVLSGCHPRPERFPLEPIPMHNAIQIVNENTGKVTGTLRASGFVDGRFVLPDGRRGGYHLDGVLFYLAPIYVRFDLKSFGDRKFLFGSNMDYYWYYDREADAYQCGRHGVDDELSPDIPIPPEQIVDALGLTPIPTQVSVAGHSQVVQRIVHEYQQILFIVHDAENHIRLQKEYWLDRYWPRLVCRVIFRDGDGVVEMESRLDHYRPVTPGRLLLPHEMTAAWPKTGARMRFRVRNWQLVEGVGPESLQFAAPGVCGGQ